MKYDAFKKLVAAKGWAIAELRCDSAPPSAELLELMDVLGLARCERFVLKLESEEN